MLEKHLGEEHPDTLASKIDLASAFWDHGQCTEAEELQMQVLETSKRVLGNEHLRTLTCMSNLVSNFPNQGW